MRYAAPPYILIIPLYSFRVGLCSREILKCRTRGVVIGVGCDGDEGDASIV